MEVKLTLATPEIAISDNAKICYATKNNKNITKSVVGDHGHLAVLRFAYASFHVIGISVAAQNQFVRSAHLDFLVESKRYVSADKGNFKFIMPYGLEESFQTEMETLWNHSINTYTKMLKRGVKKEDARAILPANTSTNLNVTGNLQGWYDFLTLRCNMHTQHEMRMVAIEIWKHLAIEYPNVFPKDKVFAKKTLQEWIETEQGNYKSK